jgi:hypothetical protein
MYRSGRLMVAGLRFGLTFVGIQPARGYQVDPARCTTTPTWCRRTATWRSTSGCATAMPPMR